MIIYADRSFYENDYLVGKEAVIDTASFDYHARQSTMVIKQYTFNRINDINITEEVKMCCCELAEYLFKQDNKDHADDVQSEKKGEWSTTYISGLDAENLKNNAIKGIIYNWLSQTGLLYRGC